MQTFFFSYPTPNPSKLPLIHPDKLASWKTLQFDIINPMISQIAIAEPYLRIKTKKSSHQIGLRQMWVFVYWDCSLYPWLEIGIDTVTKWQQQALSDSLKSLPQAVLLSEHQLEKIGFTISMQITSLRMRCYRTNFTSVAEDFLHAQQSENGGRIEKDWQETFFIRIVSQVAQIVLLNEPTL